MKYELGRIWKEAVMAQIKVLFRRLPRVTEENHEKYREAGVQAEIRTEHVPITSLECYQFVLNFALFNDAFG
jgi:hypothetical protein